MRSSPTSSNRKKQKQSRKVKKEFRRHQRKKNIEIQLGTFSQLLVWFLFFCSNEAAGASVAEEEYTLDNAASDSSELARVVNGMAIQEALKDGKFDVKSFLDELLNLTPEFSLDVLEKNDWIENEQKIIKVMTVVDQNCGSGACLDSAIVKAGINAFDEMQTISVQNMKTALEPFKTLSTLQKLHSQVSTYLKAAEEFKSFLEKIPQIKSEPKPKEFLRILTNSLFALVKSEQELRDTFKNFKKTYTATINYDTMFTTMIGFKSDLEKLAQKAEHVEKMKKELESMKIMLTTLKTSLDVGKVEPVYKMLNLLLQLVNSPGLPQRQKTLAPGLPGGFNDLERISGSLESQSLKNLISGGKSSNKLKSMLKDALSTTEQLKPLKSIANARTAVQLIEDKVEKALKELENAETDMKHGQVFEKLLACIEHNDFKTNFMFGAWPLEKQRFDTDKTSLEDSISSIMDTDESFLTPLDAIIELKGIVEAEDSSQDQVVNTLSTFPKIAEIETGVGNSTNIASSLKKNNNWATNTQIVSLVQNTEQLFNSADFGTTITCLQTENTLANAKDALQKGQMLDHLLRISPKNENFKAVLGGIGSLKSSIQEWTNWKKSRKTRQASNESSPIELKNVSGISKQIGDATKLLIDFVSVKQNRTAIKKVLNEEAIIDTDISKLNDATLKNKISKFWNPDTKKAMRNIIDHVDKVIKTTHRKPSRVTDLKALFDSVEDVQVPDFNGKDFKVLLSIVQKPDELKNALTAVSSLDLEFSSSKQTLSAASKSLESLEEYFDSLFQIERSSMVKKVSDVGESEKNENESKLSGAAIFGIICGSLLLLVILAAVFFGVREWNNRKEKKKNEERLRILKDNAVHDAQKNQTKEKEKEEKPKDDPKKGNNRTKVVKKKKKSADIGVTIPKPQIEKNPTKSFEEMTDDEMSSVLDLKSKKPAGKQQKQEQVEQRREEYQNTFENIHKMKASDLRREDVVGTDIYYLNTEKVKKPYEELKYRNAQDLMKKQEEIDTKMAQKTLEHESFSMPSRFTEQDVKLFIDEKVKEWTVDAEEIVYDGITREYLVSIDGDQIEDINEIRKKKSKISTKSDKTLKMTSAKELSKKASETKTAYDASTRTASHAGRNVGGSEVSESGEGDKRHTSVLIGSPHDSEHDAHFEGFSSWFNSFEMFQSISRMFAGADAGPEKYGFQREFKDDIEYFIKQFIAATSVEFRKPTSWDFFGKSYPITKEMFIKTLDKAKTIFKEEAAALDLKVKTLHVIGDTHAQYIDFVRHVVKVLSDPGSVGLFLGDYVDRGERNIDTVYLICLVKILFPNKFFFLRGNHETRLVNNTYGFRAECNFIFPKEPSETKDTFEITNELFDELPLCALFQRKVYLAHGGISEYMMSPDFTMNEIKKDPKCKKEWHIFYDITWSDPVYLHHPDEQKKGTPVFTRSRRSPQAKAFNQDALIAVAENMRWLLVVRAHEVKTAGFEFFAQQKAVTIFGATNNKSNNLASHMVFTAEKRLIRYRMYRFQSIDGMDDGEDEPTAEEK